MSTFGDDTYGLSQIKTWLQRLRTGDLSCNDLSPAGRAPLTLEPQAEAFLQQFRFINVHIIAMHFLTSAATANKIFRENWE
jgi:hypothetical protein